MARARQGMLDSYSTRFKEFLLSSKFFPILFALAILSILLVLFRMKSIEQDYSINEINSETKTISYENKDLKAQKAGKLSVKNLRKMANKYNLQRPKQKQIIVIP